MAHRSTRVRSAVLRYSKVFWVSEDRKLRQIWLPLIQYHVAPSSVRGKVYGTLFASLKRHPEFRYEPPFRPKQDLRLQGGNKPCFGVGAKGREHRVFPLVAHSHSFRVKPPNNMSRGLDITGEVGCLLYPRGYIIVELLFRIRAQREIISGDRLWEITSGLSPGTPSQFKLIKETKFLTKRRFLRKRKLINTRLEGSPNEFVTAILNGFSHSLMPPPGTIPDVNEPWRFALAAERGPLTAPEGKVGHARMGALKHFGLGNLQRGESGYYYSDDPKRRPKELRRRFDTLSTIFDFARYQRDCLEVDSGTVNELKKSISHIRMQRGIIRRLLTRARKFTRRAERIDAFLENLKAAVDPASKWQRLIYSHFSEALNLPTILATYENHKAELWAEREELSKYRRSIVWVVVREAVILVKKLFSG